MTKPINVNRLKRMKAESEPIAVITAYDFPSAYHAQEAGADVILVGDSLGNVVLGYDSTIPVTIDDMIHHTCAVTRAAGKCFVVTDMPFLTYHGSLDRTLTLAARIMQEGLAKAVKLEGGKEIAPTVKTLVKAGIPVMGHLGFTPQSVHRIGGYLIQGKTSEHAQQLIEDAKRLEEAGAFAIVLEMVPEDLAAEVSKQLSIPTIGIGAGRGCDGQVLVFHDLLQYGPQFPKKFVKTYADIGSQIQNGIAEYVKDVKSKAFPQEQHAFQADVQAVSGLYGRKTEE